MGINVVFMDSTQYSAAVADKTLKALRDAGESINSAARKTGIPRSTLDRKFKAGKGYTPLNVRELEQLASLAGISAWELAKVYEVPTSEERTAAA